MKFKFILSDTDEVVCYGKNKNDFIKMIENLCLQEECKIIGYLNEEIKEINPLLVDCFITSNEKVYALYKDNKYLIKKRLYELNDLENFILINQGCLANINRIDHFKASIGGALLIVFKSGYKDYVSRRRLKFVKERLGLKSEKKIS